MLQHSGDWRSHASSRRHAHFEIAMAAIRMDAPTDTIYKTKQQRARASRKSDAFNNPLWKN